MGGAPLGIDPTSMERQKLLAKLRAIQAISGPHPVAGNREVQQAILQQLLRESQQARRPEQPLPIENLRNRPAVGHV